MTRFDRYFGDMAIKQGLISNEDLKRCFIIQKKTKPYKKIGRILFEEGLLSKKQVNEILHNIKDTIDSTRTEEPSEKKNDKFLDDNHISKKTDVPQKIPNTTIIKNKTTPREIHSDGGTIIRNRTRAGGTGKGSAKNETKLHIPNYFKESSHTLGPHESGFIEDTGEDAEVGRLAVERKFITINQLKECLVALKDAKEKKEKLSLGQIMVRKRLLDVSALLSLVQEQRKNKVTCKKCGKTFQIKYQPGDKYRCQFCNSAINLPKDTPVSPENNILSKIPASKRFGPFKIIQEIEKWDTGLLYKAQQSNPNRVITLKIFKEGEEINSKNVDKLKREVELASKLTHPNIIPTYEFNQFDGFYYFTMPFIEGKNLSEFLRQQTRPDLKRACTIIEDIARAIDYAHTQGIIHRDLKLTNVIIDADGSPKIKEFGLASIMKTNKSLQTTYYVSPEELKGEKNKSLDEGVDIYSIGVIFYQLVTHRFPFKADSTNKLYAKIINEDPILPRRINPQIPKDIETIILKAMEKVPEKRYTTARGLADDVRRFLNGEPIIAKPPSLFSKALKKIKRHPAMASLIFAVCLVSILVVSLLFYQSKKLDEEKHREQVARELEASDMFDKGKSFLERDKASMALPLLDKVLAIRPKFTDAYIAKGKALILLKRFKEALVSLNKAIELSSEDPSILILRCEAYRGDGQWKEALRDINQILLINEKERNPEKLAVRASIYEQMGEFQQASRDYSELVELNFKRPENYLRRARCYQKLDMKELALTDLNSALTLNPNDLQAYVARASLFWDWRDYERAKEDFATVIKRSTNKAQGYYIVADSYFTLFTQSKEGDYGLLEKSFIHLAQAAELDPLYINKVFQKEKEIYSLSSKLDNTLFNKSLDNLIKSYPNVASVYLIKAFFNTSISKEASIQIYTNALDDIDKAIKINSSFLFAWIWQGFVLQSLQKYKEAESSYNKAISLNSGFSLTYIYLASLMAIQQNISASLENLRKAMKLGFSDIDFVLNIKGFQEMQNDLNFKKLLEEWREQSKLH